MWKFLRKVIHFVPYESDPPTRVISLRSPHIRKQKAPGNKARQLECGVVNNYRTDFDDIMALYIFGLQALNNKIDF